MSNETLVVERYGGMLDAKATRGKVLAVVKGSTPKEVGCGSSIAVRWYSPQSKEVVRLFIPNQSDKCTPSACYCCGMESIGCSQRLTEEILSIALAK